MNPYDINFKSLKNSLKITDEKDLIRLRLIHEFLKITNEYTSSEILSITSLDKADLSRLKALNFSRFSIDRLVDLISKLGYTTEVQISKKAVA